MAEQTPHKPTIGVRRRALSDPDGGIRATCSCGWVSDCAFPANVVMRIAREHAGAHAVTHTARKAGDANG